MGMHFISRVSAACSRPGRRREMDVVCNYSECQYSTDNKIQCNFNSKSKYKMQVGKLLAVVVLCMKSSSVWVKVYQEGPTSMHTGILHVLNAHLASACGVQHWSVQAQFDSWWLQMALVMVSQILRQTSCSSELYTGLCQQSHQIPQALLQGPRGNSRIQQDWFHLYRLLKWIESSPLLLLRWKRCALGTKVVPSPDQHSFSHHVQYKCKNEPEKLL